MRISPRQKRFIECLLIREHSRKELGTLVGSLNVCDVKFRLVKLGLEIICNRKPRKDRDGKVTRPGYYSIPERSKKLAIKLLGQAPTNPSIIKSSEIDPEVDNVK